MVIFTANRVNQDIRNATNTIAKGVGGAAFVFTSLICGSGALDRSPVLKNTVLALTGVILLIASSTIISNVAAEENERVAAANPRRRQER